MTKPTDVDDFLGLVSKTSRPGVECWRQTLPSDAREAIEAMEQRMKDGERFSYEAISNALSKQYGFVIQASGVSRHYREKCLCSFRDGSA